MNKALEILKNCRARGQKRAGGIDLDEAIAEIEEAMKPKTCSMCKHLNKYYCYVLDTTVEESFYCTEYEPKDSE